MSSAAESRSPSSASIARDAALIERITRDDSDAFGELIALYDARLRHFAFLTVQDVESAADVVQDVLVSLWQRWHVLSIPGTVADYLYRG